MSNRTEQQTRRARALRQAQTTPEARLWSRLRAGRLNGYKFVRQHPIGAYVADFACRSQRVVVEVDGATHGDDNERAYDEQRTIALGQGGFAVIRFQNDDVMSNLDGVCETILARLERRRFV